MDLTFELKLYLLNNVKFDFIKHSRIVIIINMYFISSMHGQLDTTTLSTLDDSIFRFPK